MVFHRAAKDVRLIVERAIVFAAKAHIAIPVVGIDFGLWFVPDAGFRVIATRNPT
jgi:hypothetical protein